MSVVHLNVQLMVVKFSSDKTIIPWGSTHRKLFKLGTESRVIEHLVIVVNRRNGTIVTLLFFLKDCCVPIWRDMKND